MEINWLSLLYDPSFKAILEKKAERSFLNDLASQEEAVSYVIEKLSEDNWAACKKHDGQSSPQAYLSTLCSHLIVEYSRKKYGRVRPPEWLKREGALWISLWQDICLKRKLEQTVIDRIMSSQTKDPSVIKQIIYTIKAKIPWCGVSNRPESLDDDDTSEPDLLYQDTSIDNVLKQNTYQQFLAIAQLILGDHDKNQTELSASENKILSIIKQLNLTSEERLILRMHYIDGMSHSAIARKMNVAKHIPARQNKKVLQKLLSEMRKQGFEFETES